MSEEKQIKKTDDAGLTLRERLLKALGEVGDDIPKRRTTVTTRLGAEVLEVIDALVKLNLFKSRSEAVAVIIEKKILSNLELFDVIRKQAEKLDALQDELESLAIRALSD